jgi:hypothetical protein
VQVASSVCPSVVTFHCTYLSFLKNASAGREITTAVIKLPLRHTPARVSTINQRNYKPRSVKIRCNILPIMNYSFLSRVETQRDLLLLVAELWKINKANEMVLIR